MEFIGLLGTIPQIIVVIAVLMYAGKRFSVEAILMAIGAIIGLISSVFYTGVMPWLFETYGSTWYQTYAMMIGAVGTLGALCFAVGLLILVINTPKAKP